MPQTPYYPVTNLFLDHQMYTRMTGSILHEGLPAAIISTLWCFCLYHIPTEYHKCWPWQDDCIAEQNSRWQATVSVITDPCPMERPHVTANYSKVECRDYRKKKFSAIVKTMKPFEPNEWGEARGVHVDTSKVCINEVCVDTGDLGGKKSKQYITHPYCYAVFSICVCFALVFRTQISYARYWEACSNIAFMSSKFGDTVVQCLAFDKIYDVEVHNGLTKKIVGNKQSHLFNTDRFRRRIVHLVSLMHAIALHTLRRQTMHLRYDILSKITTHTAEKEEHIEDAAKGKYDGDREGELHHEVHVDTLPWEAWLKKHTGTGFNGMKPGEDQFSSKYVDGHGRPEAAPALDSFAVIGGVSTVEEHLLARADDQLTLISMWVAMEICNRHKEEGIRVGPPIQSRMFQELSNGMLGFNQAFKVVHRPFPFPYVQVIVFLLVSHGIMLPVVLTVYCDSVLIGCVVTFLAIQMFFCLEIAARRIDQCFDNGEINVDLKGFQFEFNMCLESLLEIDPRYTFKQTCSLPASWDVASPEVWMSKPHMDHPDVDTKAAILDEKIPPPAPEEAPKSAEPAAAPAAPAKDAAAGSKAPAKASSEYEAQINILRETLEAKSKSDGAAPKA